MAVAPLIKPIQTQKGMLYSFQSALEDLNLTFNNNTNKFRFSKFALLRIPEIGIPASIETDNKVQFLAVGETPLIENLSANENINLAESFQNYALNLESLIISQASYNRERKLNVSERVFWKWLKELGAVRWRSADNTEVIQSLPAGESRWAEAWGDPTLTTYNRVVQYIGEIDVVNSVRNNSNSYSELYIHVPTNVGTTPTVLFNSKPDENYGPSTLVVNSPADPLDAEYLNGRRYNDTHPSAGMSLKAFYDLDTNVVVTKISDILTGPINWAGITTPYPGLTGQGTGFWWGPSSVENSYFTDQAEYFGTPYGVTSSTPKTQRIYKSYTSGMNTRTVEYLRSTLDGVVIDFDLANYQIAASNPTIKSFSQLNDSVGNQDFEFNAILLYYDIFDPSPNAVAGTEPVSVSNLYGVYFLNQVVQSGTEFIIPMITKNKPDAINKTNGNSFAYKVNLKFDTSIEDTAVEKSVNDYSTFSLNLFIDVLTEMRKLQTKFNDKLLELEQLKSEVDLAKDALLNTSALSNLDSRLKTLETTVSASTSAFAEATSIMDSIDSVNDRIDNILKNETSLEISYQTDSFSQGPGISLDKTVPGKMKISAEVNSYPSVIQTDMSTNTQGIVSFALGLSGTQVRHSKVNGSGFPIPVSLTRDLTIRIDDTVNKWKKGQVLRIVFDTQVLPSTNTIFIKTDSQNITNSIAPYSTIITTLSALEFSTTFGKTGTPIIDIVCTNPKTLTFAVDKIIR
jgi:hypothetical protein